MKPLSIDIVVSEGVPRDTVLAVSRLSLDETRAAVRAAEEYAKAGMPEPAAWIRALTEALMAANKVAAAKVRP